MYISHLQVLFGSHWEYNMHIAITNFKRSYVQADLFASACAFFCCPIFS